MADTIAQRTRARSNSATSAPVEPLAPIRCLLLDMLSDDDLLTVVNHLPASSATLDLTRAGMACKRLAQLSHEADHWAHLIKFPPSNAEAVSDTMLEALLTRVRAAERTRAIVLHGCTAIRGFGLKPLHGSTRLEEVDLRLGSDDCTVPGPITGLQPALIRAMVGSMLKPGCKLEVVHLRRQHPRESGMDISTWDPPWRFIVEDLRHALEERKRRDEMSCNHCNALMARPRCDRYLLEKPACVKCRKFSCSTERGCPIVIDCTECGQTYCGDCDLGGHCAVCLDQFCHGCRMTTPCDICKQIFCESCKWASFCDACRKPFCEDCRETFFCDDCRNPFCTECRDVNFCDTCVLPFCAECREVIYCEFCQGDFCYECGCMCKCDKCDWALDKCACGEA